MPLTLLLIACPDPSINFTVLAPTNCVNSKGQTSLQGTRALSLRSCRVGVGISIPRIRGGANTRDLTRHSAPWAGKFTNHLSYRLPFCQFYWPVLSVDAIGGHRPSKFEDRSVAGCTHPFFQAGHNDSALCDFFPFRLSFNTAWSLRQIASTQKSRTCECWWR